MYLDNSFKEIGVMDPDKRINLRHVGGIYASDVGSPESRPSAKWGAQLVADIASRRL
jgi:hypothetical protein